MQQKLSKHIDSGLKSDGNSSSSSDLATKTKTCQRTKAILVKKLKSKENLQIFMKRADKKESGWLRRKHVETLVDRISKKMEQAVVFDDDVWRSIKETSRVQKMNFVEHEVFEQWVFGV